MFTVRHIERYWESNRFGRMLEDLVRWRIEALVEGDLSARPCLGAAALGLIRLDELDQPQVPLSLKLIRAIITQQESDGGWGDVMLTALCLRALSLRAGEGQVIARGMTYLANLQQLDGIWPRIPFRRMPADPVVSAFTLLQLGDHPNFRTAVRLGAAVHWFQSHDLESDELARTLWSHARPTVTGSGSLFPAAGPGAIPACRA